jgi:hypothetical protein
VAPLLLRFNGVRKVKPVRRARSGRNTQARKSPSKRSPQSTVPLIVRLPPEAIARLRAAAAVRRLTPGRVLAVALRLYERHLQKVLLQ